MNNFYFLALEATGTDRVHVLARGDTRRFRYRTSVIVGNILRYFDTMRLQRFKGKSYTESLKEIFRRAYLREQCGKRPTRGLCCTGRGPNRSAHSRELF